MALNNREEVHFWRELERVEQWLSTGAGAAAGRIYDTMGRPGEQTFANYGNELVASVARVERVRQALDQSGPMAKRLAMQQLSGIGLDDVWDILLAACKEIALYYGGAVVTGAVVGGAIGSLAFGAGAIPGAVVGGAAGSQVGIWVLTLLGLKELVVGLGTMFPVAMEHYVRGFREAWGAVPDNRRDFGNSAALSSGSISAGAWHMGQGHFILVTAILTAVVAYLTRGGGTTASLAQMARQSRRLGAKFANWAVKNERKLLAHPQLQSRPNNSVAMAMGESLPTSGRGASGPSGSRSASGTSGNTKVDAVGANTALVDSEVSALQRMAANNRAGSPAADLRSAYQQAKGQVDFAHIEADVRLNSAGVLQKAQGGHFSTSPLVDIIPGTESVGANGSMWAKINLKGPDGNWYQKTNNNGFSSLTPDTWSLAQAKGEMSQAFLGRTQLPNGNWMGSSSGVDFRFYPPTKNVPLWRGFPEYTP
ncbi:DUF6861 domain-containing protein [Pseudoduganella lutea]|uniref:NAD(+)--protein-arginine ADP-ribosyltransferase Tre1-like N-terminal domain-containing protein n=1 Tax=Pseudoduganella lutea TaxID=321985 RepID=A0A4P6L2K2_9BURK|nr:EndoU domain-containing protein [Pseudoduganella lutea]QBE65515.1 hypothetical protein EWM63_23065 [Pseudoduganella lutea]